MPLDPSRYRTIAFSRQGRVLTIHLDRPDALNAVNAELHEELSRVFVDAAADAESDVVVLTGNGRAFCAGGDIDWMQHAIDTPGVFERTGREARQILLSQVELDKPLIARVNGHATGLGCSLALFCDIAIAAENAKIGDPHVAVGLVAGDGGAVIWPQLVGYQRAKEFLLTGDLLTAADAARIGLINRAVPAEGLDEAVYGLAQRLAQGAQKAIRWTKLAVNLPLKQLIAQVFDAGAAYEGLSAATEDHREAVAAFREKRKPVFRGR